jgi:queuosine precursor transporter
MIPANSETKTPFGGDRMGVSVSAVAMIVIVAASNWLVQFPINDWLTWGAFSYPFSFLVTDLTNRRFGPAAARRVIYVGFAVGVVLSAALATPRIAAASGSCWPSCWT